MERVYNNIIFAIRPVYKEGLGDCSLVYLQDRTVLVEKTIQQTFRLICRYYMIDIKEIKRTYGDLIDCKDLFPIPFDRDNIFIALKFRKPLYKNDRAFGYVNLNYIEDVYSQGEVSIIELTNQVQLESSLRLKTIQQHIKRGRILRSCYRDKTMAPRSDSRRFMPATKEDILLILRELEKSTSN